MIFSWLFNQVLSAITSLLSVFPTWTPFDLHTLITDPINGTNNVFQYLRWANYFIPLTDLVTCLSVLLTFYAAHVTYKSGVWLLEKVHVLGGSE
jgi:hypothetical protein